MKVHDLKIKLFLALILVCIVPFAFANNKDDVSLEQASETIRKESKGQVVSATTSTYKGVRSHQIKVLSQSGRVKVYHVPASGKNLQKYNNRYDQPNQTNNSSNYRTKSEEKTNNNRYKSSNKKSQSRETSKYNNSDRNRSSWNNSSNSSESTSSKSSSSNGGTKKK